MFFALLTVSLLIISPLKCSLPYIAIHDKNFYTFIFGGHDGIHECLHQQ